MKRVAAIAMGVLMCFSGCANQGEMTESQTQNSLPQQPESSQQQAVSASSTETITQETVDYSDCFADVKGSAVFYSSQTGAMKVYQEQESETRYSPCSTFKIITALLGLENGVLFDADSTMQYSGAQYPVAAWNQELGLKEAFQASCVWYFKQVMDQLDTSVVQKALDDLQYGNCDISEWNGSGLNPSADLNGFWLESSLKISPKEQVRVLSQIFDGNAGVSDNTVLLLKDMMQIGGQENGPLYGKTGSGKSNAWFVGFYEKNDARWYFAVHLQDENDATGKKAQEIAQGIIKEHFAG